MISKTVEIKNKLGLHARPAAAFVKLVTKYDCEVKVEKDGFAINAKSIMGVMMLAAEKGSELEITCDGADENECLNSLVELVDSKFGEE